MCLILKVSGPVSSKMALKKSVKLWDSLSLCVKHEASIVKWVFRSEGWSLILLCCLFSTLSAVFQTLVGCLSERASRRRLALVSFIAF